MARLLPLPSAVLLLLLPLPLPAATIHVPSQEPTIQAGLDAASAGDTVLVSCGTYYEHDLTMTSGVTLRGETGEPSCVTIDAEYLARAFYLDGVGEGAAIEGLSIRHGFSGYAPGGAMYAEACTLPDRARQVRGQRGLRARRRRLLLRVGNRVPRCRVRGERGFHGWTWGRYLR